MIVVDDHVSPAAAWVLLEEIKEITNKPVTTVINTHFHFDHAHGNQIFEPACRSSATSSRAACCSSNSIGDAALPELPDRNAGPDRDAEKADRREQEPTAREGQAADAAPRRPRTTFASQKELKPTPPNVTLTTQMTLYRGDREIQIRYLGRGHTAGDVVVYLPNEKVVITGDFLTSGMSNMSDSFPNEWVASLDELKKLDFDTVMPGHGEAFTDKAKIDYFQAYLRDVWSEVSPLKKQGVSAEEAAKRADLTKHKEHLPIRSRRAADCRDAYLRQSLERVGRQSERGSPGIPQRSRPYSSTTAQRPRADRDSRPIEGTPPAHRVRARNILI